MNINEILKNNNLDKNEQDVIKYLYQQLKFGNDKITIRQLSKATYASTSSIVRLAKRIGFYGYSDMVFSFRKQLQEVVEFKDSDTLNSVIISSESLEVIDELIHDIVSNKYPRIHLIGAGYSLLVCEYMRDKLVEQNFFATCSNPMDLEVKVPALVIYVSNSGETKDVLSILLSSRAVNHKTYVVSSQENSTICKMIDNKIIIKHKEASEKRSSYFTGNAIILMEKIANAVYHNKIKED